MDGATRLLLFAGVPSGAAVISATTPAVAAAGDAIPKGSEFEVVPESATVIAIVPGVATMALVTCAANPVLDPNWVASALPFH